MMKKIFFIILLFISCSEKGFEDEIIGQWGLTEHIEDGVSMGYRYINSCTLKSFIEFKSDGTAKEYGFYSDDYNTFEPCISYTDNYTWIKESNSNNYLMEVPADNQTTLAILTIEGSTLRMETNWYGKTVQVFKKK